MEYFEHHRRPWTILELKFLIENAGVKDVEVICNSLHRTEPAVRAKVSELRRGGLPISLRKYPWKLKWCSECATWRTKLFHSDGRCSVCHLKSRLVKSRERSALALSVLPLQIRMQYESYEPYRGSRHEPMPKRIIPQSLTRYESDKILNDYYEQYEAWEAKYLIRCINAEKSRLKRIKKRAASS